LFLVSITVTPHVAAQAGSVLTFLKSFSAQNSVFSKGSLLEDVIFVPAAHEPLYSIIGSNAACKSSSFPIPTAFIQ
jgi:hypothetical protein